MERKLRKAEKKGYFPPNCLGKLRSSYSKQRQLLKGWLETGEYKHGKKELAEERYNRMDSIGALA